MLDAERQALATTLRAARLELPISTPFQQSTAMLATRDFLLRLIDHRTTPRIPREVRREARSLLRHYPPKEQLQPLLQAALGPASVPQTGTKREPPRETA